MPGQKPSKYHSRIAWYIISKMNAVEYYMQ